jgi:hypothetical protein
MMGGPPDWKYQLWSSLLAARLYFGLLGVDVVGTWHYRKMIFIHWSKLTNITSKPMNIDYIRRLTDEYVDKHNSDELIWSYSLTNITIYSSVLHNRWIYPIIFIGDRWPMNIMGWGGRATGLTGGPLFSLNIGPSRRPVSDMWPIIFVG